MERSSPPVVAFDIGGVLARISNTWQQAAATAGIKVKLPNVPLISLEALPAFLEYQGGAIPEADYFAALGAQLGVGAEEALKVHNGILIEPYEGTLELVAELEDAGVTTAVLSNTNRPHWVILDDPAIYPAIARIERKMPSHEMKMQKPDPRLFTAFCEAFGFVPQNLVYFDDSAKNVETALSLGWRATRIDPEAGPVAQMRDVLVREGILGR